MQGGQRRTSLCLRLRRSFWNAKYTISLVLLAFHIGLYVGLFTPGLIESDDDFVRSKSMSNSDSPAHVFSVPPPTDITLPLVGAYELCLAALENSGTGVVVDICTDHFPALAQVSTGEEDYMNTEEPPVDAKQQAYLPERLDPERISNEPKGKVMIFTMDSLEHTVRQASFGRASGEIRVREDLQEALQLLGMEVMTIVSDEQFRSVTNDFTILPHGVTHVVFDEWTIISPNHEPREFLRNVPLENIFLLAFFGMPNKEYISSWLRLPATQILMAHPYTSNNVLGEHNTLLGYYFESIPVSLSSLGCTEDGETHVQHSFFTSKEVETAIVSRIPALRNLNFEEFRRELCSSYATNDGTWSYNPQWIPVKQRAGLIWGKERKYLQNKYAILGHLLSVPNLQVYSSVYTGDTRIEQLGHLPRTEWTDFLKSTAFLIGLGDPVLGPSALEAIAYGAVYINPIDRFGEEYHNTADGRLQWPSQHAFAQDEIGFPYVCNYSLTRPESVLDCVEYALSVNLPPYVHHEYTKSKHLQRVMELFLRG